MRSHIKEKFSFLSDKKLLIACSGGVDSVVLTEIIDQLGWNFSLAHCNFALREKESDRDEMFVVGLAASKKVPIYIERFDTKSFSQQKGVSIQLAARILRYEWFESLSEKFNYDYILTGHHLDDDLETFFINFSRGTGIRGLSGIPEVNHNLVRPLLDFSREKILSFSRENKLKWREDLSNQDNNYLRNHLRNVIIPPFKKSNPQLLNNFRNTRRNLKATENLLEDYMALVYKLVISKAEDAYHIHIDKLKNLPHTRELLYELLTDFGFTEWENVINLIDAQSGKAVYSPTHRLLKDRDTLILTTLPEGEEMVFKVSESGIEYPIFLKITNVQNRPDKNFGNEIYIDAEKINFPLYLRKRKAGDVFYPLNFDGKKKVSKFFKDEKFSQYQKENTWLLCNQEEVVWIVGYRQDDRFKVDNATNKIIKIAFKERRDEEQRY